MKCVNIESANVARGVKTIYNFRLNKNFLQVIYDPTYNHRSQQVLYNRTYTARNLITGEIKTKNYTPVINIPVFELNNSYPLLLAEYTRLLGFSQVLEDQKHSSNSNNDNNSIYKNVGITDEITICECCGKSNLKKTVVLQNINNGNFLFVGSECKNKYNIK